MSLSVVIHFYALGEPILVIGESAFNYYENLHFWALNHCLFYTKLDQTGTNYSASFESSLGLAHSLVYRGLELLSLFALPMWLVISCSRESEFILVSGFHYFLTLIYFGKMQHLFCFGISKCSFPNLLVSLELFFAVCSNHSFSVLNLKLKEFIFGQLGLNPSNSYQHSLNEFCLFLT